MHTCKYIYIYIYLYVYTFCPGEEPMADTLVRLATQRRAQIGEPILAFARLDSLPTDNYSCEGISFSKEVLRTMQKT